MNSRKPFRRINAAEARILLTNTDFIILDVRQPGDFARGHIPGARNISVATLYSVIDWAPKSLPILIYCYHGYASQEFAQIFSDFRFEDVYSLDGGYEGWITALEPEGTSS